MYANARLLQPLTPTHHSPSYPPQQTHSLNHPTPPLPPSRDEGFFLEVLASPATCFNASHYAALLLVDSEDEFYAEEVAKLAADVEQLGLGAPQPLLPSACLLFWGSADPLGAWSTAFPRQRSA